MKTIQKLSNKIESLAKVYVPSRLRMRFTEGVTSFGLTDFTSLNTSGRMLRDNPETGKQRIYRLGRDVRMVDMIRGIILREFLPKSGLLHLSLDHSQFGPFYIAVLALCTRRGRAIPVWLEVQKRDNKLMRPLIKALDALFTEMDQDTSRIVLTMDRWFASPQLFQFLDSYHVGFICRTKSDLPLMVPWDPFSTVPAGQISHEELTVSYADMDLRFVRSDYHEGMKQKEPWFLLTNITEEKLSRRQVVNYYAKRFEIEEFFKDIKWIQRYEWHQIRKKAVMQVILSFAFLGWWLLYDCLATVVRASRTRNLKRQRDRLSWFRSCWEAVQRELRQPLLGGANFV
jgi:Transposase DDE domain